MYYSQADWGQLHPLHNRGYFYFKKLNLKSNKHTLNNSDLDLF